MHLEYHDILKRIAEPPKWWLDGVPRYDAFSPHDATVYARQVALVHIECRDCGTRYDVALVYPNHEHRHDLRYVIDYGNAFETIGDPPNACPQSFTSSHGGATMTAIQVAVLEFWERPEFDWIRNPSFERPLRGAKCSGRDEVVPPGSAWDRLERVGRLDEWRLAARTGDFAKLVELFSSVGCEFPHEVANMVDIDHRHEKFWTEMSALRRQRHAKP